MQIAPEATILLASTVEATPLRPRAEAAPVPRPQTWIAPSAVGRGRLIDLVV